MDLGETAPHRQLNFGLARMHHEMGEHRDFLPDFIARLQLYGAQSFWKKVMAAAWDIRNRIICVLIT